MMSKKGMPVKEEPIPKDGLNQSGLVDLSSDATDAAELDGFVHEGCRAGALQLGITREDLVDVGLESGPALAIDSSLLTRHLGDDVQSLHLRRLVAHETSDGCGHESVHHVG